jgi:hypothetical protein
VQGARVNRLDWFFGPSREEATAARRSKNLIDNALKKTGNNRAQAA